MEWWCRYWVEYGMFYDHGRKFLTAVQICLIPSRWVQLKRNTIKRVWWWWHYFISPWYDNLELKHKDAERTNLPMILDSSSAIAIGNSFKETKHTRHIMIRFHFVRRLYHTTMDHYKRSVSRHCNEDPRGGILFTNVTYLFEQDICGRIS